MTLQLAMKRGKSAKCSTVREALIYVEDIMVDEHYPVSDFEELWQQSENFKKNYDINMKIELAEKEMIAIA